jgi:uncharacterized protein involved in exopolysaccharide biosynthesis
VIEIADAFWEYVNVGTHQDNIVMQPPVMDSNNVSLAPSFPSEAIGLLDVLVALARYKRFILYFVAAATLLATVISVLLPNVYVGVAKVMPPERRKSIGLGPESSALSALASRDLGLKDPNDIYMSMLRTDRVADALIHRFNLETVYKDRRKWKLREKLHSNSRYASGSDFVITIEVDDKDPKRAADLANAYVEELDRINQDISTAEAAHRREYFERELQTARENLTAAEQRFRESQEHSGMVRPEEQTKAMFEQITAIRGKIAAKEVQISSLRTSLTPQNVELRRAESELTVLRSQLSSLENSSLTETGGPQVSVGKAPSAGIEYARRMRDVKYYETVYTTIENQFQVAHMDEVNNMPVIQPLESAGIPERKSGPKRALIVLSVMLAALVFSCIAALVMEGRRRSQLHGATSEKMRELAELLRMPLSRR